MTEQTTRTEAHSVMKALTYEAVLIHPVAGGWGWTWYRDGDVAALTPYSFDSSFEAGQNFCSLLDFKTIHAPVPDVPDPSILSWSTTMAMVGIRGVPIYVVVPVQ